MERKKYCSTCEWYDEREGICSNGESNHRAEFRCLDDTCEKWRTQGVAFFMAMVPPTVTHQEKQVHVVKGKPVFYEPADLKAARQKLMGHLAGHRPEQPFDQGIRLMVKWSFPERETCRR